MANKSKSSKKSSPDQLIKTTTKNEIELKEDDLRLVTGGATGGAGAGKIKFNE
jgi:hypothetical protein